MYLDLFDYCRLSMVLNNHYINLVGSCIETLGEYIPEVKDTYEGNRSHLEGKAIDVSVPEFHIESHREIATSHWISPTTFPIKDKDLSCF